MKSFGYLLLASGFILATATASANPRLSDEVEALGGNASLLKLSTEISPDKRVRVVQNRLVPRQNRFEFGTRYGQKFGGDAYLQTQSYQLNLEYHLNPRFSFGVLYSDYGSQLSPEGKRVFTEASRAFEAGGGVSSYPDVDAPQNSLIGQVQFYPMYGKINFFDQSIIQFDMSLILGAGQITLASGPTSLLSTGIGAGFWITRHISARLEMRYEAYQDRDMIYNTQRDLQTISGNIGIGVML